MNVLVLAEKPTAAKKIAQAIESSDYLQETPVKNGGRGKVSKKTKQGRGRSEGKIQVTDCYGNRVTVVHALGHLHNLVREDDKRTKTNCIIKPKWTETTKTLSVLDAIRSERAAADLVVVATDYDVEGELIAWNILRFVLGLADARRMRLNSLTPQSIREGYERALDDNEHDGMNLGMCMAGESRHLVDWLYGINVSRILTAQLSKVSKRFATVSMGRVQCPTLGLLVAKEDEILSHVPQHSWHAFLVWHSHRFEHPKPFESEVAVIAFLDSITSRSNADGANGAECQVSHDDTTRLVEPKPAFDLHSLQKEGHRLWKMPPNRTMQVAQAVYMKGWITYPRTSSQRIPDGMDHNQLLRRLSTVVVQDFDPTLDITRTSPLQGEATDPAHSAIIPTDLLPATGTDRSSAEYRLYDLVVRRYLATFMEDSEQTRRHTKIKVIASGGEDGRGEGEREGALFSSTHVWYSRVGWAKVYPSTVSTKPPPACPSNHLNCVREMLEFVKNTTNPPPRFSVMTLVNEMQKLGLGTKSTRANIATTLVERGYITGGGGGTSGLCCTALGRAVFTVMRSHALQMCEADFTSKMEKNMESLLLLEPTIGSPNQLQERQASILADATNQVQAILQSLSKASVEVSKALATGSETVENKKREDVAVGPCPQCEHGGELCIKYSNKSRKYFVACGAYPKCTKTYSLPSNNGAVVRTTGKIANGTGNPILVRTAKGKRPWEFEFDPHWLAPTVSSFSGPG